MRRSVVSLALFVLTLLVVGCSTTSPVAVTSNPVGSKIGEANTTMIFGFFPDGGDAGIYKAAKNGGITRISTVDFKRQMVFLYLVQKYTTIVSGE